MKSKLQFNLLLKNQHLLSVDSGILFEEEDITVGTRINLKDRMDLVYIKVTYNSRFIHVSANSLIEQNFIAK